MTARPQGRRGGRHPAPHELVTNLEDAIPDDFWEEDAGPVARALRTSAVLCIARQGFHSTTTRDITSAIGLSPGALYVHFATKEEVLYAIVRCGHARALESLRAVAADDDVCDYVERLVGAVASWHARHHVVARVCQYEMAALTAEHLGFVLELRQQYSGVLRSAVERGIARGVFDVPDAQHATRAVLSLGIDPIRWYRTDGPDSPETVGRLYGDLALRMLGAGR